MIFIQNEKEQAIVDKCLCKGQGWYYETFIGASRWKHICKCEDKIKELRWEEANKK